MLFLDLGLISGLYVGTRLISKFHKKNGDKIGSLGKKIDSLGKKVGKKVGLLKKINNPEIATEIEIGEHPPEKISVGGMLNQPHIYLSVVTTALTVLRPLYPIVYPLHIISVSLLVYPIFRLAEKSLIEEKKARAPVLTSIFIVACITTGQYIGLAVGSLFFLSTKRIVAKTRCDLRNKLTGIFNELPDRAWVLKDGIEVEISLDALCIDDIVVCNTGNIIPADGVVIEGAAMIDQHILTGEFQPSEKTVGEQVFASTIVMNGRIQIKVEKTGQQTTVAKIEEILNNTADFKSDLQLKGEKWADQSVLPMLGISAVSLPVLHLFGVAAILNCGFESRIMMLAPLGTLNHLNIASRKKIFIKDGRALEQVSQIDTVLFDKTGTLTSEQPEIGKIICYNGYDEKTILSYAATAECKMSHPIARAIVEKATALAVDFSAPDDSNYTMGYGISVKIDTHLIRVGSIRFMKVEGILISETMEKVVDDFHEKGHSVVMLAVDDQLAGIIEMQPALRPEVVDIITGLRARGVKHLSIVSGDQEKPVQKLAETLGMDSYFAEILPENKASIVEQLKKEGRTVCFIGDGINDTIAMKKADVSISLSGATSVATDVAQVVLMDGSLSALCDMFDLSKNLKTNSKTTLGIMLAGTAVNVAGVFLLHFGVTTTILVNVTSLVFGVINTTIPLKKENVEKINNH
jgi:heavy metal translocating P-type ATPase